jgi:O-antigen ligase
MAPTIFPVLKDLVWISFAFISLLFIIMANVKASKRYPISKSYKSRASLILIFFYLYFVIAMTHFFHKNPVDVLQHDIRNIIWYSPIIFFLPYYIHDNDDIRKIFKFLIFNGAIIGVFGVLTKLLNLEFLLHGEYRVLSTMGNPNNLAFFLNILIFTTLSRLLLEKKVNKVLMLLLLLFIVCVLFTVSLTNILALLLGTALIFLLTHKLKRGVGIVLFISVLGFVLFNFGFLGEIVLKYNDVFDKTSTSSSYYCRIQQVQEIGEFLKNENFGSIAFGDFSLERYRRYDNQYWNILRNDGLILLICFLLIFISIIRMGLRKAGTLAKRREYELSAVLMGTSVSLLTILIVSFNGTAFLNRFPLNFLLYLLIGLTVLIKTDFLYSVGDQRRAGLLNV